MSNNCIAKVYVSSFNQYSQLISSCLLKLIHSQLIVEVILRSNKVNFDLSLPSIVLILLN